MATRKEEIIKDEQAVFNHNFRKTLSSFAQKHLPNDKAFDLSMRKS